MKKAICFLVNVDYYFLSHRLEFAQFLQTQGYTILLITEITNESYYQEIMRHNIRVFPLDLKRGREGLADLYALLKARKQLQQWAVEYTCIVHAIGLKMIAASLLITAKVKRLARVGMFTGLGAFFTEQRGKETSKQLPVRVRCKQGLYRWILQRVMQYCARSYEAIVQNSVDKQFLLDQAGFPLNRITQIYGSGIDCNRFLPPEKLKQANEPLRMLFVGRLLADKGLYEYIKAVELLMADTDCKERVHFYTVGPFDTANPSAILPETFYAALAKTSIQHLGAQREITSLFAQSDILVLPSYREGLPKVVLEAQAMKLPVITSDAPGCAESILPEQSGCLVPVGDVQSLAQAMRRLINNGKLRKSMGEAGRLHVLNRASNMVVFAQMLQVYHRYTRDRNETYS